MRSEVRPNEKWKMRNKKLSVLSGQWSVVIGQLVSWSVVIGQWSVGQWSLLSGQFVNNEK